MKTRIYFYTEPDNTLCDHIRNFLDGLDHDYKEIDIRDEANYDGRVLVESLGVEKLPVVMIDKDGEKKIYADDGEDGLCTKCIEQFLRGK